MLIVKDFLEIRLKPFCERLILYIFLEHTVNFILRCFLIGLAEMNEDGIGSAVNGALNIRSLLRGRDCVFSHKYLQK